MSKVKFSYPAGRFTLYFRWTKEDCDWTLDYRTSLKERWRHFGLVCTGNNKYVWGDGLRNFGDSLEDAQAKLQLRCAEFHLSQIVQFNN